MTSSRPIPSTNPFASAIKTLFHAPYYELLCELRNRERRALPTGRAGLIELGFPPEAADAILETPAEMGLTPMTGIIVFTERLFALRGLHYPDERKLRNFYREKRLDRETLSLMRSRIDTVIQQFWPAETTGPIARTPFDFAFEQLDRSAIADRVRRPRRAANSATAKRQRAA